MTDVTAARLRYERALEAWREANAARQFGRRDHRLHARWPEYSPTGALLERHSSALELREDAAYDEFIRARDAYLAAVRNQPTEAW